MSRALDFLAAVQLGTGLTDVYTFTTGLSNAKLEAVIWICNTDVVERTMTLRIGIGTLTVANSLFDGTQMTRGKVYVCGQQGDFSIILREGWKIQGLSDLANKVTVTVFGAKVLD